MRTSFKTFIAVVALHIALAYGLSQVVYHPAATSPKHIQMVNIVPTPLPVADAPSQGKTQTAQARAKVAVTTRQEHQASKPATIVRKKPDAQPQTHNATKPLLAITHTSPAQTQTLSTTPHTTTEANTQTQPNPVAPSISTSNSTTANTPPAAMQQTPSPTPAKPKGETTGVNAETAYLSNPKPEYPAESKDNGEEGTVYLSVKVSATGSAQEVSLHKSSGYINLDRAAIKAVKRWRFNPAKKEGIAVEAQAIVPIKFFI